MIRFLAITAGGLGLMRPASGTWGSTPPVVLVLLLLWLGAAPGVIDASIVALGVAAGAACVVWGAWAESRFGGKDPGAVVADEVAGQCVALLLLPWQAMRDAGGVIATDAVVHDLVLAGSAFLLFRILDIVKPPPANGLQRIGGGWGILIDDLFAGLYALILMQLGARVLFP